MAHENEQDLSNRRNVPKFFVEHPHISWDVAGRSPHLGLVRL